MTEQIATGQRQWPLFITCILAGAIVIGIELLLMFGASGGVLQGRLFDPDCYMHLQRALRLMTDGWQVGPDPRINAPFGYSIHWTNLFDSLSVAGAAPLRFFGMDAHTVLFVWGSAISPMLLIATLSVFAWGVRPWANGAFFLWLTFLMFLTMPQLAGAFLAGRPDHHSLILGLLLAQIAWLYAFFDGRAGFPGAIVAGVLAGVQMCTSVEALMSVAMVIVVLGMASLFYGTRVFGTLAVYLAACVATMLVWFVLEHGPFLLHPAYDRVSIVHVVALGLGTVAALILALAEARGWLGSRLPARVAWLAGAGVFAGGFTAAIFPDFFLGPWPHLPPEVVAWHATISELKPLLPTTWQSADHFLVQLTAPLLSLPLIVAGLRRRDGEPFMLVALVGFVMFGILALAQMRWSAELQAATLLPWALTTRAIMRSTLALRIGQTRVPLRGVALSGALLLQMVPSAFAHVTAPVPAPGTHSRTLCDWSGAAAAMRPLGPPGSIVMTDLWWGPEILWRSDLNVVGAPYEIPPALTDTNRFLGGDETAMHEVIARRHIRFVLLCTHETSGGFSDRLTRETPPAWLKPMALADLPEFRLYRVMGN